MKQTIFIDDISSIAENIFSFKYKRGLIKKYPFNCKKKPEQSTASSYHFDSEELKIINELYKRMGIYDVKGEMSKKEYILFMKEQFYHIIQRGEMVALLSRIYGVTFEDVEFKWAGSNPPKFKA